MTIKYVSPFTLTFFTLFLVFSHQVYGQPFTCDTNCRKFGNCNLETGECECPLGRAGKACENDKLPACRITPESPGRAAISFITGI